ncbi:MAG TPA: YceD family protein [Verrucomicrobiae bacterium]|nr:YceD family protein [Verrucomicrobiae bacterium]
MKRPNAAGIPKHVSASKAIAMRQRFVGQLALEQMPRLVDQLAHKGGAVAVELEAGKDAAGLAWLRGRIEGNLSLTCQRGLHPFPWSCVVQTGLRLVASEAEEEKAMKETEATLIEDDQLLLRDLVEDEILLALPIVPRCDDPDCAKQL